MTPKVSVIIPAYNAERTLRATLASIQMQTLKELEIIVVDDGSTDRTGEIAAEVAREDHRIVFINQPNGGCYRARLAGMKVATGTYFGFVDSDDSVLPEMYERLYSVAEQKDADVVECGWQLGGSNMPIESKEVLALLDKEQVVNGYVRLTLLDVGQSAYVWNKIYRLRGQDFSQWVDGDFGSYEDLIHNLQLFKTVESYVRLSDKLYLYAPNDGSVTRNFSIKALERFKNARIAKGKLIADYAILDSDRIMRKWVGNELKNFLMLAALAPSESEARRRENVRAVLSTSGFRFGVLNCLPILAVIFMIRLIWKSKHWNGWMNVRMIVRRLGRCSVCVDK